MTIWSCTNILACIAGVPCKHPQDPLSCCRDLNRLDNAKSAKATDALLNYETVKYFSNEELERRNFEKAIRDYQKVEYTLIASLNGLNVLQSVIIWSGMIGGLIVCTQVITHLSAALSTCSITAPLVLLREQCLPCLTSVRPKQQRGVLET